MKNRRVAKPYQCDVCGARCKSVPGLLGHKRFRHQNAQQHMGTLTKKDLLSEEEHSIRVKVEELRLEFLHREKQIYESDIPEAEKIPKADELRKDYLFRILAVKERL